MKGIFGLILTLIFINCHSQTISLPGEYTSSNGYINITDSILEFKTLYGCCLLSEIYGFGTYKIANNKIVVNTIWRNNENFSNYRIIKSIDSQDKIELIINNFEAEFPFSEIIITIMSENQRKEYNGYYFENKDSILIENLDFNKTENKIIQIFNCNDKLQIPLNNALGKSIVVNMKPYRTIQNERITFNIFQESHGIKIVGPYFEKQKQDSNMSIKIKLRTIISNWPWNWNLKYKHEAQPIEFRKNE